MPPRFFLSNISDCWKSTFRTGYLKGDGVSAIGSIIQIAECHFVKISVTKQNIDIYGYNDDICNVTNMSLYGMMSQVSPVTANY